MLDRDGERKEKNFLAAPIVFILPVCEVGVERDERDLVPGTIVCITR